MKKRVAFLLLAFVLLLSLASCGVYETDTVKPLYTQDEDGDIHVYAVMYNGVLYRESPYQLVQADYEPLSQFTPVAMPTGSAHLFSRYAAATYVPTTESPLYLINHTDPYAYNGTVSSWDIAFFFREDYDPMSDVFRLEGTDFEAPLSFFVELDRIEGPADDFPQAPGYYQEYVFLTSTTHDELSCELTVYDAGKEWRYRIQGLGHWDVEYSAPLSEEAIALYKQYGIIKYEFIE